MFDIQKIIATALEIGAGLPAYKALFDQVVATFSEADQTVLKDAYAKAIAQSDAAHQAAQGV